MTRIKERVIVFLSLILVAGASFSAVQNVDVEEAAKIMNEPGVVILDVRTREEFAQGYIEKALLIPVYELESNSGWWRQLPTDKTVPIVVYCTVGVRSSKARKILKEHGYVNTYNLKGGIVAWEKAGHPVVKPAPKEK